MAARNVNSLKVPKCESFDLMDSRDFYTLKLPWVGGFGTVIKIRNCFVFEVFSRENFELVHAVFVSQV